MVNVQEGGGDDQPRVPKRDREKERERERERERKEDERQVDCWAADAAAAGHTIASRKSELSCSSSFNCFFSWRIVWQMRSLRVARNVTLIYQVKAMLIFFWVELEICIDII